MECVWIAGNAGEPWVILVLMVAKELLLNYQNSSCLFRVSLAELVALGLAQPVPVSQSCSGEPCCCLQVTLGML